MKLSTFFTSDISKLFYIYLISYMFFLLNYEGIYWDDWTLYNVNTNVMLTQFKMNGGILTGYLHKLLLSIGNGVFVYRVLSFFCFFMSGLFVYKILKNVKIFKNSAFWIIAFYLTLPLNSAKIALINVPAIIYLCLFFLSFYLLVDSLYNEKLTFSKRIIILIIFFLSFNLNSLLVFYAITLIFLLYKESRKGKNSKCFINYSSFKQLSFQYIDFIILPILYFIIKQVFFKSYGLYENYNKIVLSIERLKLLIKSFYTTIYEPIYLSISNGLNYWYILILIIFFIWVFIKNKIFNIEKKYIIVYFGLGLLIYVLAVFSYIVVGKLPHLYGWESRHQVLTPLGISFILYSIIGIFSFYKKKLSKYIFIIFLSCFVLQDLYYGYKYTKDWYYQISIQENFKNSILIKKHTTFIAKILLEGELANNRKLRFYELNGMMKKVFKYDKRLMVSNKNEIKLYKKYKFYPQYNFSTWKYEKPIFIEISEKNNLNFIEFFKMLYYQFTNYKQFLKMAKKLVCIKVKNV